MLIIRLAVCDEWHNFVLDTGSDSCTIDKSVFENVDNIYSQCNKEVAIGDTPHGSISIFGYIDIPLTIDDKQVEWPFAISNIHKVFEAIEKEHDIKISGLIGCDFMEYYKTIIDFKRNQITFHM